MKWIETDYMDPDLGHIGYSRLPDTPGGWWVLGARNDSMQSRARPFTLCLVCAASKEPDCLTMFADTGEAFSYFERGKSPSLPSPYGPAMSLGMMGFSMPAMTQMPMPEYPLPDYGRPLRHFSSIGDYLDQCALDYMGGQGELRMVSEEVIGGLQDTVERERRLTKRCRDNYSNMNGRFTYVVNKQMSRTVMRTYELAGPDGSEWTVVLGAKMAGFDFLVYERSAGITTMPADIPFGRCSAQGAIFYDVEWMSEYRFGGRCPKSHKWAEFLAPWCKHFSATVKFDKTQMDRMRQIKERLTKEASERNQRDVEGLRRLTAEMHEENRRRQERLDWERARSWERQQESDRRIREGRSAVLRGVEQYRGPYGELIEIPISGPCYRAYYDRTSDTVLHTDRYMGDGWQELPRWKW